MFPPATPLTVPKVSSQVNSPSITGIRQYRRPSSRFADLPAVAEVAEPPADVDGLLAERQAVVAGRGRAGHHALADPVGQRLLERIAAEGEEQDAHAGPAVRASRPGPSTRSTAASASQPITLVA